jgi:hypothetical protein
MLAIAVTIAYWQVFENGFVTYDDPDYITANKNVSAGLTLNGIIWAFSSFDAGNWHPLTWIVHIVTVEMFGLNSFAHHGVSLFLHSANTALVFLLLHRLTGAKWRSVLVALLFGLHPLHVESVAWASELKDVLCAFFFLLTIHAYTRFADNPCVKRYIPVVLLYILALLSKPMAITLPGVLLLIDYWPLDRLTTANSDKKTSHISLILEKTPLILLTAVSCRITWLAQNSGGMVNHLDSSGFILQCGNAIISYTSYLGKMLWPVNLTIQYPFDPATITFQHVTLTALPLLAITCTAFSRYGRPWLKVGWLWYIGTLIPVIGLVSVGSHSMADRYTYIPSIGVFIILVWSAASLLNKYPITKWPLSIASIFIVISLGITTYRQVTAWHNSETLYRRALSLHSNNWLIHNNLAVTLIQQGNSNPEEALYHLLDSISLNPDFAASRYNLGKLYLDKLHDNIKAAESFQEALRINPDYAEAHFYMGVASLRSGEWGRAENEYKILLQLDRKLAELLRKIMNQ